MEGEDTLTPTVDEPGWYYFTVTDNDSNCPITDSVFVEEVITLPNADAGPDTLTLSCLLDTLLLGDIDNTSTGNNYTQEWYLNDVLVSMDFPYEVNETGIYILTVTNNLTGCMRNDTIEIIEDILSPTADAGDDLFLTCTNDTVLLDGSGSYVNDEFTYVWINSAGDIIPPFAVAQAIVDTADTYTFIITNIATGCFDSDDMEVSLNLNLPIINIENPDTLTCQNTEIQLTGTVNNLSLIHI